MRTVPSAGMVPSRYAKADFEAKDRIYQHIIERFRDERGEVPISRTVAKEIFATICDYIFASVVEQGVFRFPNGLGVLAIRRLGPTKRVLPDGSTMELLNRPVVRYNEGSTVKIMLNKRDKYQNRKEPKTVPTLFRRPNPRRSK